MTRPECLKRAAECNRRCPRAASNFIDAADIPLAAEYDDVHAFLVDARAEAGRAHGERHQLAPRPIIQATGQIVDQTTPLAKLKVQATMPTH
jgi:hypothetical protein